MQVTDEGVRRTSGGMPGRVVVVAVLAATFTAANLSAQESSWESAWGITMQTRYDDNPLRLNEWEKANVGGGLPQFEGIDRVHDVLNTIRLRGVLRGPGLHGRRARIEADIPVAAYTFSRRRPQISIGGSALQELSSRDEVTASLSFTPSEFQRNYLTGVDASGSPVYAEGAGRRLQGSVGYTRRLLSGRGGRPELDAGLSLHGARRSFPDFPWRDRNELGGRLGLMFQPLGFVDTELAATRTRMYHASLPEPVSGSDGVTMIATRRDYVELELEAEAAFRVAQRTRVVAGYARRNRDYLATLSEDVVYGDRRDHRNSYHTELRFRMTPAMGLTLGGAFEEQARIRPGRGDTGDEADYRRKTVFLSLSLLR